MGSLKRATAQIGLVILLVLLVATKAYNLKNNHMSLRALDDTSNGADDGVTKATNNLFSGSFLLMKICHSISETKHETQSHFFLWALIRVFFFGDKAGSCVKKCSDLCFADQCNDFLVTDQEQCICQGSVCDANASCEASVCRCNEGYEGNGEICCDSAEYYYVEFAPRNATCSLLNMEEFNAVEMAIATSADNVDTLLLDTGEAVPELQSFVALVRERIPTELNLKPSDRDILMAMMAPANGKRQLSGMIATNSAIFPLTFLQRYMLQLKEECIAAVTSLFFGIAGFIMSIIGLGGFRHVANPLVQELILNRQVQETAAQTAYLVRMALRNGRQLSEAQAWNEVFQFFWGFLENVKLEGIIGIIKREVPWVEWIIAAVICLAELTALFLSAGAALTLKIGLLSYELSMVVKDGMEVKNECPDEVTPPITLPPVTLPPAEVCSDDLNSGTCELFDGTMGRCPGRTFLSTAYCRTGICCAKNDDLKCIATGGRSGVCLSAGKSCLDNSGNPSLVIPTELGPCNNCCVKEGVVCRSDENNEPGVCVKAKDSSCQLPSPSIHCSSLGTPDELACCIDSVIDCSLGDYEGACMETDFCKNIGGASFPHLCTDFASKSIQCCLSPGCISYGLYPGECLSEYECTNLGKTPFKAFNDLAFSCVGGQSCCVEPPLCASGSGGHHIEGTCIDESACRKKAGFEPVSGLCKGPKNIQCCMDLSNTACDKDGTPGRCKDKDRCSGEQQIPFLAGDGCPGDYAEIQCCVDLPSCVVAGTNGACLPKADCMELPALSWHNCPGKVSNGISCCIPALECGGYDNNGLWVYGQCQMSCSGTTYPITPLINSELEYCPDGLVCCIPKDINVEWQTRDINGPFRNQGYGFASAISADAWVLASGYGRDEGTVEKGFVQAYAYKESSDDWKPLGLRYFGGPEDLELGKAVALSADGILMVVGAPSTKSTDIHTSEGAIKVLQYSDIGDAWGVLGDVIYGNDESLSCGFGSVVAISSDGMIVAGGTSRICWSPETGYTRGVVRILRYNNITYKWDQLGQALTDEDGQGWDGFGSALALNGSGDLLVVSGKTNTAGAFLQVYQYDGTISEWVKQGSPLKSPGYSHYGGFVALSADGSLLATTSHTYAQTPGMYGSYLGYAHVYHNPAGKGWELRETFRVTLWESDSPYQKFSPFPVALSTNGSVLVTGWFNQVHVFEYRGDSEWVETSKSTSFTGDAGDDELGHSVGVSSDGSVVVAGAPWHDGPAGTDAGLVRVYRQLL